MIPLPARAACETKALADYGNAVGKVFIVNELSGYADDAAFGKYDGYFDLVFDAPVRVRVLATNPREVLHWVDEHLDPYWDVEVLDRRPDIPASIRSAWIFGGSYNAETLEGPEHHPVEDYSCVEKGYY